MENNCCIDFNDLLNEKLKDPEFKEGLKRAEEKLKLELELNELLQKRGINDFFVEVKNINEYWMKLAIG